MQTVSAFSLLIKIKSKPKISAVSCFSTQELMILHVKFSQKIHRHYGKMETIIAERDSSVSTNTAVKTPFKILRKKKECSSQTECRELHLLVELTGLSLQNTKVISCLSDLSQIQLQDSEAVGHSARCKQQNRYVQDLTSAQGTLKRPFSLDFQPACAEEGTKLQQANKWPAPPT